MLLLSSLPLLTPVVLLSLIVLLLVAACMLAFTSLVDAPKGETSTQVEPPQIFNKSSYLSLISALLLVLPAKYILGVLSQFFGFFRAISGMLFWLNPFEFLIHLKKHQNLMTPVQNMMVGVHICEPFLFWLPHATELCLQWSPYLRIPFWPCSLLNILSNFSLFVLYLTETLCWQ